MHTARLIPGALALTAISFGAIATANAKTMTLATDRVGSTFNAMGTGVAKTITAAGKDRVIVKAFGGPEAYLRAIQNGEVDMAVLSASSAYAAFNGRNKKKVKFQKLRLLRAGTGGLRLTFVVPAKTNIMTYKDLKGRKVASSYGGHAVIVPSIAGALSTVGLTWDDVVKVPVTGVTGGIDAIAAGRAEASWSSFGMPATRQLHSKIGIRYLGLPPGEESEKKLRAKMFPGVQLVLTKANPKIGLPKDAYLISYESYIIASPKMSADDVKRVMATLWEKTPELQKAHRGLKGFTHDVAASKIPMVPFHPAAIEFYKGKKLWGEAQEKANAEVLAATKK
ncbi:MAG: TAXI family TRAP transporter solute-binding subunit [Hyphomicrobiales bacterium]|nr:TAXI family TRAP transporter solute-binding subunit [Hyphomicrobiales bacterium]